MQPYQLEYIENCKKYRELTALSFQEGADFDASFSAAMEEIRGALELAERNKHILQNDFLPVLDDLYDQPLETWREMEEFADALYSGSKPLDLALAEQLYTALLSVARRLSRREIVIRILYKLGMARYGVYNMLTSVSDPSTNRHSMRMRYCFIEAGSYLKYYQEFDQDTLSYILRSQANTYMGRFENWRDRLAIVRLSMQIFNDDRYRAAAPDLAWDRFVNTLHVQMVSVFPRNLDEGSLSPTEVEDVMESAHLIYELQYEEAAKTGQHIDAHRLMPYYEIECACGLITKEELLAQMEEFMDTADPTLYNDISDYRIISMPAFYIQYLRYAPELLPPRKAYLALLLNRTLNYIRNIPAHRVTAQTLSYMRQILTMFQELEGGVTYLEFTKTLLVWIAPDLYAHGYAVGRMAQAMALTILEGDPGFFDDMEEISSVTAPAEKRAKLSDMAFTAGLLHDMGKLHFTALSNHAGRPILAEEDAALQFHTVVGGHRLAEWPSTQPYADAALGHHRWYDGSDGYPEDYNRRESPYRALVDVVALADYLESEADNDLILPYRSKSFEAKLDSAVKLGGRQFSPLVTAWLHEPHLMEQLKDCYENGRREGFRHRFLTAADHKAQPQA